MEILKEDIGNISTVGELHGDDVKMIVTKGGFHVFIGKKNKNSRKAEALTASSHKAIGFHQLEKIYGKNFNYKMAKSEHEQLEEVENNTNCLSKSLVDKGIELYILSKNNNLEFILYKHGLTVGKYETEAKNGSLLIKSCDFNTNFFPTLKKEAAQSVAKAMEKKMKELNLNKVEKNFI